MFYVRNRLLGAAGRTWDTRRVRYSPDNGVGMRIPCHRPRAEREVTGRETGLVNLDLASEYGRLTASSAQG
jgi:hypothetical protein